MSEISNQVLSDSFRESKNFFESDLMLSDFFNRTASLEAKVYFSESLNKTGRIAAKEMDELSMLADKNGPTLVKRNRFGETIDEIKFHPSYWDLMQIAIDSQMFSVKWKPDLRQKFEQESHLLGFSAGYLYALSEMGQFCPLCMTDGVARLIDRFCEPDDKARLLPKIYTDSLEGFATGAMFLTEKSGGSDVGRNIVQATKVEGNQYVLNGEKWFCSNANAQIIFALARTNPSISGTKGLSIFLVEPILPNGERNSIEFVRLKDKLGVRSMASAECIFKNAKATLVGEEFQGFKIMTEMINLSRIYNAVAAVACSRRAMVEAYQFLTFRISFGKNAIDHALIQKKINELTALQTAGFYMTMHCINQLDKADNGDDKAGALLRLLTPMTKKWTAEKGVYIVRESMELMGGMGYIEDGIMPKLMRDMMVLPIWEGAGNVMTLDMLRAAMKSNGLAEMVSFIDSKVINDTELRDKWLDFKIEIEELFQLQNQNVMEWKAEDVFHLLTDFMQVAVLKRNLNDENKAFVQPSIDFFKSKILGEKRKTITKEIIVGQVAWNF